MKTALWAAGAVNIFALSLLLAGCDATAPVIPQAALNQIATLSGVKVTLDIRHHSQWTPARLEKAQASARVLETVLNSPEFSRRLGARRDLQHTEGLSAVEILQVIRSGRTLAGLRDGSGTIHNSITLPLSVAPGTPEYANHEGFTDLDTGIIYARRDWLDNQTQCRMAGLLAHEYMHVVGFTHATFNHPWRRLSVPYAVGDLVIELSEAGMSAPCAAVKT